MQATDARAARGRDDPPPARAAGSPAARSSARGATRRRSSRRRSTRSAPRSSRGPAGQVPDRSLDDDRELIVHLGMTGVARGRPRHAAPDDPYVRAGWTSTTAPRSSCATSAASAASPSCPRGVYDRCRRSPRSGPEPLADDFDRGRVLARAAPRAIAPVKTQLLSPAPGRRRRQHLRRRGALARRACTPRRAPGRPRPRPAACTSAIREVLAAGIDHGGTTLRDYRTPTASRARTSTTSGCYGQGGQPCLRCGQPMRRTVIDARSTTYCPRCQR